MKILKLLKDLKIYIFAMIVFSIIQVFCELYLPNIMSDIVDVGIVSSDKAFIIKEIVYMLIITVVGLLSNIMLVHATSKFSNIFGT